MGYRSLRSHARSRSLLLCTGSRRKAALGFYEVLEGIDQQEDQAAVAPDQRPVAAGIFRSRAALCRES
jgi:hypothetical protein